MPFLSRNIDRIGNDAGESHTHRDDSLKASFGSQASPKIRTTGTLVERLSSFYATRGKHLFDAIAAFFLIILFAPLMVLIAILIKSTSRGPIFFSHKRVGLNNELFVIHKFRSLDINTPSYSEKPGSTDDKRITSFGKWLRKTSLDELPQLFNVLKSEMSLVGPRPEMPFLAENYEPWENQRHLVRPGMTGLWQLSPRRRGTIRDGISVDLAYIENLSLWNDFKILIRTFKVFWDNNTY
jgi:lipopolysaccharide/colanic/teichoic acid biosynthesis glycosyltransferase